jgi:hypothetical protein
MIVLRYLIRDRDGAYGAAFIRRIRAMGISDRPVSARLPWQNRYAERLIGSIRRECLDHVVVVGERHLRHVLASYQKYYNEVRTHLPLQKDAPVRRDVCRTGCVRSSPILGGLQHQYVRVGVSDRDRGASPSDSSSIREGDQRSRLIIARYEILSGLSSFRHCTNASTHFANRLPTWQCASGMDCNEIAQASAPLWRHRRSIAYSRQGSTLNSAAAFVIALCLSGASTIPSHTPFLAIL